MLFFKITWSFKRDLVLKSLEGVMLKKTIKILVFLNITLLSVLLILYLCIKFDNNDKIIYSNIHVLNVDLSNLDKDLAIKTLNDKYNFGKNLVLTYDDLSYEVDLKNFGFSYNMDKVVNDALNIGRDGVFIDNIFTIIDLQKGNPQNVPLDYSHNFTSLQKHIEYLTQDFKKDPINARIEIKDGKINHIKEIKGVTIDMENLLFGIRWIIEDGFEDNVIYIPVIESNPELTLDDINLIDTKIASYSTYYSTNEVSRAHNITIGAEKVDNLLVMPGESISFNDTIGNLSWQEGFQYAPVIVNGDYVPGIGGGVCQISSTLYNSLLNANIEILERHRHSKPSSYVPYNRDATVSPPYVDLKFKNNHNYPIFIHNYASKGVMTSEIYSSSKYNTNPELEL